jgi:hypothetical protein
MCMCVCVCVCVCERARIYWAVLESKPRGNENFCTRQAQTTSCIKETNIFTRLQQAGLGVNHPRLTDGENKETVEL